MPRSKPARSVVGGSVENEQFGDYVLLELIGRGGMGEVFRAHDTLRKRTVALKRLPAPLAKDEAFRKRFRTESEVAARLSDPHVLPIHDFGEIDGRLFIDMRHVEGSDLAALLRRHGALDPTVAVDVLTQVASALDAAHRDELVHRDVKPSNVLVTLDETGCAPTFAYLTDFGVAQIGGANTALSTTNATAGTVDYMAPERFTSRRIDHRADVYSLGCVLYEMLAGDKPFAAESMPEAMYGHIYAEPPKPSEGRPDLPTGLDPVVARAMAKKPEDRYPTCGQLAADARAQLAGRDAAPPSERRTSAIVLGADTDADADTDTDPVAGAGTVPPPPSPPGLARRRRRRPLAVTLGAAGAAVALTAAVVLADYAAAPGESEAATAAPATPTTSATAPTGDPSNAAGQAGAAAPVAPAVDGVFAGRSSGNEMTVAVATRGGRVAAYLCDGESVEAWLEGSLSGRELRLQSRKGAVLTATLTDTAAFGSVTVAGRTLPFSAELADAPAGLYEARQGSTRTGWIVLEDGSQVGLSQTDGVSTPAPRLDPADRTATGPDGPITAVAITGDQQGTS